MHNNELQRTDEWFADRLGCVTASQMGKVIAGGQGKTRKDYLYTLAAEIITGERAETYQSQAMANGTEREPQAIACLEFMRDIEVKGCGFIRHPAIDGVGVSPDGLIGDDGVVEVKCPSRKVHLGYLMAGKLPPEYKPQVQAQMWCTERGYALFCSYHPKIKPLIVKVPRDQEYIEHLRNATMVFLDELRSIVKKLS